MWLDSYHRRHPSIAFLAGLLIAALVPVALIADPPSNSESSKYPRRTAQEKPESPKELDPKMDCPWLDHIFDDQPVMSGTNNLEEYRAYNYFVTYARRFSPELMAKHTREELTFRRLFEEPQKYRGEIVRVQGRLKRLTWIDTNKQLGADGVKNLYEAWIFGEHYNSNPTCVILSELPPDVQPGEDIRDVNVVVDGYFFKRYKYKAGDGTRLAPLVIARTLAVINLPVSARDAGEKAFDRLFLPVVFALLLGMVGFAFVFHRWFRRGDRKTHEVLRNARSTEFIAPTEMPAPPAPRAMPDGPSWN